MPIPESETRNKSSPGLLQSLRGYLATWVDLFRTRLDLFSTELQEEQERLQQLVVLGAAALFCLALGALLVTLFVVAIFWETNYRLAVLGGLALLYLAAGTIVALVTRKRSRARAKLFSATLGELTKDYHHLSSQS
jgi:uncharacterized membrane protein YqjE